MKAETNREVWMFNRPSTPFTQYPVAREPTPANVNNFILQGDNIQIAPIVNANLHLFKELNKILLPVSYHETFYLDIVEKHSPSFCLMAFVDGSPIAAITCRKECFEGVVRLYIMTLGVLPRFRRRGLASFLLERVLTECKRDPTLEQVCLHVHVRNQQALKLYMAYGFEICRELKGYYEVNIGVDPPDAYFLTKKLK